MAIQLYNLEGQPLEQIPDGSPIPDGRWTTPTGGRAWQQGVPDPATQSQQPTQSAQGGYATDANGNQITSQSTIGPHWGSSGGTTGLNQTLSAINGTGPLAPAPAPVTAPTQTAPWQALTPQQPSQPTQAQGPATTSQQSPMSLQSYLTAHPEVVSAWNSDPGNAQAYGTLENYARQNAKGNGNDAEKLWGASYTPPASYQPATAPTSGGNYNQAQNASQLGTFNTSGTQNTNQAQTSGQLNTQAQTGTNNTQQQTQQNTTQQQAVTGGQTQQQTQTGTNAQTGTSTQQEAGNVSTLGNTTTRPVDTLGFGSLLQGQVGQTQADDQTRSNFLNDVVNTGGQQFGSQVDQAVRQSLTGPQVTGAGDSARARAAGYAGAQVARNNLDERLNAAGQLAGPTGLQSLVSSGNPFLGQSATTATNQATTGATTGTNSSQGTNASTSNLSGTNFQNLLGGTQTAGMTNTQGQNTLNTTGAQTGFQNLVGSTAESNTGSALGQSSQAASGQIPQAQQVQSGGGGGCVLCTAATELGLFHNLRVLRKVIAYKLSNPRFHRAAYGYFYLFTPLARFLVTRPRLAAFLYPLARMVVYEELRVAGRRLPRRTIPFLVHWTGHFLCELIGRFPTPKRVTDPVIEHIARKNNIWFYIGGVK